MVATGDNANNAVTQHHSDPATPPEPPPPPKPSTMLILTWPPEERADATVTIDGAVMTVPKTGPVEYPLEIRDASHRVRIARKGFRTLDFPRQSREGDQLPPYPVRWVPSFDEWVQDFEEAKHLASAGQESIFIVFDASDGATNAEPLMRRSFPRRSFSTVPAKIAC